MPYLDEHIGPTTPQLIDGWVEYGERIRVTTGYDWYITLTFEDDVVPYKAKRELSRWLNRINRNIYRKNWRNKGTGITGICAIAYPDVKYRTHIHGLLCGADRLFRRKFEDEWFARNGWARIRVYDDQKGPVAIQYICDHIKSGAEMVALSPRDSLVH